MSVFSSEDKTRIGEAISRAEKGTSGEIVVIVTRRSDEYRYIALMWAALIALTLPLLLIYMPQLTGWRLSFAGPEILYLIQLVWFIVLAFLFQLPMVRPLLAPSWVKRARAKKNAMEQFVAQNLHGTNHRTGVLIFVSLNERFAEIIADQRIADKVDKSVWQQAVNSLTDEIGRGRAADGFIAAVNQCGLVLAAHFPPGPPESDELPNHVIELE